MRRRTSKAFCTLACLGISIPFTLFHLYFIPIFTQIHRIGLTALIAPMLILSVMRLIYWPILECIMRWNPKVTSFFSSNAAVITFGAATTLSFTLLWIPWMDRENPVNLTIQICLLYSSFDISLTIIISIISNVIIDSVQSVRDRKHIVFCTESAVALSSLSIIYVDTVSDGLQDVVHLQSSLISAGLIGFLCTIISTALHRQRKIATTSPSFGVVFGKRKAAVHFGGEFPSGVSEDLGRPIGSRILRNLKETWNLFTSFSFLWPTLGHFARRFRIILDTSFLYIYVQLLLEPSDVLIPGTITFTFYVITCCSVHSPLLWAMWPMLTDSGPLVFNCVLTIATIINCINMLIVGRSHPTVIMVFLLIENTFCRCGAEAVYCCFSSAVATRNDRQNTKRKPTSATFNYALRTVITNPAEQLGFILVLLSLSSSSYPNYIAEPGRYGEKCPPLPIARLNYTQRNIGNTSTSVPIFEFDQTHINKRSIKLRSLSNDSIDNIQRILLIDMDINQQESSTTKERERRAADTTENHRRLSVTSGYGVTQRRIFSSMVTQSVPQTAAVTPNSSVTVSRKYSTLLGTIPPATPILNLDHFGSNKHSEYLLSKSTEFKPVNTILGSIEKIETSTLSEESSLLTPTTENTESRENPVKRTNEKDTSSTLGEGITTTEGSVWTNESDVTTIMPSTEPQQEVKPSNYTFVEEEFYYDDETTPSIVHYKFSYSRCQGILDVVFLVAVLGPLLCAFIELIAMYLYRRYFHFQRNLRVKRLESSTEVL